MCIRDSYKAVILGQPVISRNVTVTGDGIRTPKNFSVLTGTDLSELVDAAGGLKEKIAKAISGGPMMGFAPVSYTHLAGAGSVKVSAAVPGKVVKIVASVGQSVKAGDSVVIVESMKMEIPVVAPQDGTIASIDVAEGAAVENGDTLATMN